jgi:hypothetical protein
LNLEFDVAGQVDQPMLRQALKDGLTGPESQRRPILRPLRIQAPDRH